MKKYPLIDIKGLVRKMESRRMSFIKSLRYIHNPPNETVNAVYIDMLIKHLKGLTKILPPYIEFSDRDKDWSFWFQIAMKDKNVSVDYIKFPIEGTILHLLIPNCVYHPEYTKGTDFATSRNNLYELICLLYKLGSDVSYGLVNNGLIIPYSKDTGGLEKLLFKYPDMDHYLYKKIVSPYIFIKHTFHYFQQGKA